MITRARTLLVLSIGIIAVTTLIPLPDQARQSATTPLLCLPCGDYGTADLLLNVLLFIPLGLALGLTRYRAGLVLITAATATFAVETAQYFIIPGRDASLGDVVANTTGGMVGFWLAVKWRVIAYPLERYRAWFLLGAGLLPIGAATATIRLLRPMLPDTSWYTQWAPSGGARRWFAGQVEGVSLNGITLPWWRVPDRTEWEELNATWEPISFVASIVTSAAPEAVRPGRIASISDDRHVPFLILVAAGDDLRFGVRTVAARYRLRSPVYGLRGGLAEADAKTVIEGRWGREGVTVSSTTDSSVRRSEPTSLSLGWTVLLPGVLDGSLRAAITGAMWVALLFLPLGYYAGPATIRWRLGVAAVVLVGSLWLAPVALGVERTSVLLWFAAVSGILAGGRTSRAMGPP